MESNLEKEQMSSDMTTKISYEDLTTIYAPIYDSSTMIENMIRVLSGKPNSDDEFIDKFFGEIGRKPDRAKGPLWDHMIKIEKDNPDQFS